MRFFTSLLGVLSLAACASANIFWTQIDYLYWHYTESTQSYALHVDNATAQTNPSSIDQENTWGSGFRLSACYETSCTCWNTRFAWTRFHNSVSTSTNVAYILASQFLMGEPAFTFVGGDGFGGPASSKWDLKLDLFDLDWGFDLYNNCACYVEPRFGIKGGVINQNQFIQYTNFHNASDTSITISALMNEKNNFWGVGPKLGLNSGFNLWRGWDLVGDFAMAALYGKKNSPSTLTSTGSVTGVNKFSHSIYKIIPMFQFFVGFEWNSCFCECYDVLFAAGYETQYFWNLWRTQNSKAQQFFVTNAGFGDLMFNGLTVKLAVGF